MFGATKSLLFGMDTATDTGLASLRNATTWLNSPPLTAEGLRGKGVLVGFCTYTYVNWLGTPPYARAWAEKDAQHRPGAIGADTPELGVAAALENVRRHMSAGLVA